MHKMRYASAILLLCVLTATIWAGGSSDPQEFLGQPPELVDVTELATPVAVTVRSDEAEHVTLTVDQAVDYALTNSDSLKSAMIDLELKHRAKKYSWNVVVPTVQATGTLARSLTGKTEMESTANLIKMLNPATPASLEDWSEKNNWAFAVGINASLNLSAALVEGIKATRMNYEAGLITWEQTRKDTDRNIRKLFYGLLLQQRNLSLQQESLENARQRMVQARINYQNGLVPELSYLQAQVAYENKKPSIMSLEQSLEQQMESFCFLLGYPLGTKVTLDGTISTDFIQFDAKELASRFVGSQLDVLLLQKNIDIMKAGLRATQLQTYTPALALSASWNPNFAPIFNDGEWRNTDLDTMTVSATLAFNLTGLLPFSSAAQSIKDSQANIAKMQIALSLSVQNAELQIYKLVDALHKSEASIKVSEANIVLAQKAYNQTVSAFNAGTTELLDVKDAESQLEQAKLGLQNEQFNYISTLLDLSYTLNVSISDLSSTFAE